MPTYGSFNSNGAHPYRTWEADFIKRDKDVVEFYKYGTGDFPTQQLVAVANLEKGWTISELTVTKMPSR